MIAIETDGSVYLERVKIGEVIESSDKFVYEEGESVNTVWKDGN